jgi:hypothetical protein
LKGILRERTRARAYELDTYFCYGMYSYFTLYNTKLVKRGSKHNTISKSGLVNFDTASRALYSNMKAADSP